tara:strand:- start:6089 stop:6484 length:396 start_codon:yes stop_codon:yes gene_type:complete
VNQAELFPVDPPAPAFEHGGYVPPATQTYRGQEFPGRYRSGHGMITRNSPTLFWLMDRVMEVLKGGSVHWYDMSKAVGLPIETYTLSWHLSLMVSRGLIHAEEVYLGGKRPGDKDYAGFQYQYSLPEEVDQ